VHVVEYLDAMNAGPAAGTQLTVIPAGDGAIVPENVCPACLGGKALLKAVIVNR
jgi:hypothetical protein